MLAFKAASRKDSPQPMESRPASHLRLFQAHGGSNRNDSPHDEVGQQTYRLESLIGHVNNHPPGIFIPVLRISSILIPLLPIRVARASMSLGLRQISPPSISHLSKYIIFNCPAKIGSSFADIHRKFDFEKQHGHHFINQDTQISSWVRETR